ncbi:MAG TPA: Gfo/Idh/MocA family oxidoreductase [Limnochordales bacterium]
MRAFSQPIRLALLGCGRFGWRHLEAFQHLGSARAVVVADIDEARARETARHFSIPHYTTDFREAACWPDVEAVDICLPTYLHAEAVQVAAEAGRHIFCEKPLALTPEQARQAVAACRRAGVKLQVGFCRRFDNGWLAAAQVIRSGVLGRPVVWRHATGTPGAPQPWFFDIDKGGGPFVDGAIHWYDFGRFLFGEAESVVASTSTLQPGRTAPDTGVVSVRFASGDQLQLLWSWGLPAGVRVDELHEVLGPRGALTMVPRHGLEDAVVNGALSGAEAHGTRPGANGVDPGSLGYLWLMRADRMGPEPVAYQRNNMVEDELAAFVRAVQSDAEPAVGGEEAVAALEIAWAVLESARSGRVVHLAGAAVGSRSPGGNA